MIASSLRFTDLIEPFLLIFGYILHGDADDDGVEILLFILVRSDSDITVACQLFRRHFDRRPINLIFLTEASRTLRIAIDLLASLEALEQARLAGPLGADDEELDFKILRELGKIQAPVTDFESRALAAEIARESSSHLES